MTDTQVRRAVTAERAELAELLAGLDAEGWDSPTLCAGWRVREVVAHITMPYRLSSARLAVGMVAAFGNFNRLADRTARMDAATLSTSDLLKSLWDNVDHPWRPPGGGLSNALSHDVIHGLDITVALGLDRLVPEDRMRLVLDTIDPRTVKLFGAKLGGIELRADDLDFSYGSGTVLSGRAQDLLLVLCGRKLPAGHLSGEPAERFTARD
ncbi:maleylpyruvate isomerase family mycothiol-dependent enzyme [Nocardia sp. NPDC059691]|uniref:maleylpyruvate isomerase family mycothiol-dependent enzyme n=1 Tax=unclassified Nocardia TaxID=2637762 RepID=UPI0036965638